MPADEPGLEFAELHEGMREVRSDIQVWVFDPTIDQTRDVREDTSVDGSAADARAKAEEAGYTFVAMGLAYRKGTLQMVAGGKVGLAIAFRYP